MLRLALVDEENCFSKIADIQEEYLGVIQIDTVIAKSPCNFEEYVERLKYYDVVGLHRQIWIDECDKGDKCFQRFKQHLGKKVYGIGKPGNNHTACSEGLAGFAAMTALSQIHHKEIIREGDKVNLVLNGEVKRRNQTALELTIIGEITPAFTLQDALSHKQKYFKYIDLTKIYH